MVKIFPNWDWVKLTHKDMENPSGKFKSVDKLPHIWRNHAQILCDDRQIRKADDRAEAEYERRTEGVGAEQAAAIAVEISVDRRKEESGD